MALFGSSIFWCSSSLVLHQPCFLPRWLAYVRTGPWYCGTSLADWRLRAASRNGKMVLFSEPSFGPRRVIYLLVFQQSGVPPAWSPTGYDAPWIYRQQARYINRAVHGFTNNVLYHLGPESCLGCITDRLRAIAHASVRFVS